MAWNKTANLRPSTASFVTIDTAQTVTGAKIFTGSVTASVHAPSADPKGFYVYNGDGFDPVFSSQNRPSAYDLSATGTPNNTTFLRGDNTWVVLPTPDLSGYATLANPQTFTGAKNFTGGLNVAGVAVVVTSDSRLSDARTPTAHAATHGGTGSDPITITEAQVTGLTTDLAAKVDLTTAQTVGGAKTYSAVAQFNSPVTFFGTTNTVGSAGTATSATQSYNSRILQWGTSYWNGAAASGEYALLTAVRRSTTAGDLYLNVNTDFQSAARLYGTTGVYDSGNRVYSAANLVPVTGLSATGTASSTSYLRGDGTWAGGALGQSGEVASYSGPAAALAVPANTVDTTSISVTWNSIAGHRYKITAYVMADSDATVSTTDVHFVVPGQSAFKYLIYNAAASAFLYGNATGEFTETATQVRTVPLSLFRPGGVFTVRAGSVMLNVEDITPGANLIVVPSSTAPAQNVVLGQTNSSASITLSSSPQLLPGCSYTLPVSGTYEVTFAVDFTFNGTTDGALVGGLYLDGTAVAPVRQAVFYPITAGARQVQTQTALVTGTAGQVLTLQSYKASGTGTSTAGGQHSGFTVILPGTGNLDSDSLNLMGAL